MAQSRRAGRQTALERLVSIGVALSAERNRERLLERIAVEAQELCGADGGTLYLRTEQDTLRFAIMRTKSLGIRLGGTTGEPINLPDVPLYTGGAPNHHNVASHCALEKQAVNIPDAYAAEGFDFSGTRRFDEHNHCRSTSFLAVPMINQEQEVIGVLQLLNAHRAGRVVAFTRGQQEIVEALASQAAVALENATLLAQQRALMESFVKVIAGAIDDKSAYTGAHCRRVPVLTEMLARAICEQTEGPLAGTRFSDDDWHSLRIAAWLHDCGKVITPMHIMDKRTKLETIVDRMEEVRARFAVLKQQVRAGDAGGGPPPACPGEAELDAELRFLEKANLGGESMKPEDQKRVAEIAQRQWRGSDGRMRPLLTEDEVRNLQITRGTLTEEERTLMNSHAVQTLTMLADLPFPAYLKAVPEYAGTHHEKMNGKGYPRGIFAGDLPMPARIIAVADIFESLTATDRPYKVPFRLSQTMEIMGKMKQSGELDPDVVDVLVRSGAYREYAKRFLPAELIDEVDGQAILAIKPQAPVLPPEEERRQRRTTLLPQFRPFVRERQTIGDWGGQSR